MNNETHNIKPIDGFPNYVIMDGGRVFSTRSGGMREIKAFPDRNGYLRVLLYKAGCPRGVNKSVHSLVGEAFLGPRPAGLVICHNNGTPTDNRSANLRYDTQTSNQHDRRIHGTTSEGEKSGMHKLVTHEVLDIRERCRNGESQQSVADSYGVTQTNVSFIMRGKTWRHLLDEREAA
jgi:hypothetical protein